MGLFNSKPELTLQMQDKRVKLKEDIVFQCKANNLEGVKVIWEKDGLSLPYGGRISIRQIGTELSLTIKGAKGADEGNYTLRLSKGSHSVSHTVKVTVLEFEKIWRSIQWGENVSIKHNLEDLTLKYPQVKHLRFLLHGPVGAGKSSIINSIQSIFKDQVEVGALVAAISGTSFTKALSVQCVLSYKLCEWEAEWLRPSYVYILSRPINNIASGVQKEGYKTYQIKDKQKGALPFVFSDIMGLENEDMEGSHPDDIINILKGNVREGYMLNSKNPLSEDDRNYNSSPTLGDKIHCLISVIPADKISLMEKNEALEKMGVIRKKASDLGIPQVVFMTCVDLVCPAVNDDLKLIYSSKNIKRKMQECSNRLGVPMNCIFPVKNYHEENNLDSDMDSLILDALKNVVNFAESYVDGLGTLEH